MLRVRGSQEQGEDSCQEPRRPSSPCSSSVLWSSASCTSLLSASTETRQPSSNCSTSTVTTSPSSTPAFPFLAYSSSCSALLLASSDCSHWLATWSHGPSSCETWRRTTPWQ